MQRAIGIRRAIVKHEPWAAARNRAQLAVQVGLFPFRELLRFALCEIGLHRKAGFGEIDGVFVVRQASRSF
jgi:hypothetical protein